MCPCFAFLRKRIMKSELEPAESDEGEADGVTDATSTTTIGRNTEIKKRHAEMKQMHPVEKGLNLSIYDPKLNKISKPHMFCVTNNTETGEVFIHRMLEPNKKQKAFNPYESSTYTHNAHMMKLCSLVTVKKVRLGEQVYEFGKLKRTHCFLLQYSKKSDSKYLVADSEKDRDAWVSGIRSYIAERITEADKGIEKLFKSADKNNDGALDLSEIRGLLHRLNVHVQGEDIVRLLRVMGFNKLDRDTPITRQQFKSIYLKLSQRKDIERLFVIYSGQKRLMTAEDVAMFLRLSQGQKTATEKDAASIIDKLSNEKELRYEDFLKYMLLPENFLFNHSNATKVYQEMGLPLADYFIACSYSTEEGAQPGPGPGGTVGKLRVLCEKCRCLELGCWDGPGGTPIITIGNTTKNRLSLYETLTALNEFGFSKSRYPLILSLELHLKQEQRDVLASNLKEAFKEQLFLPKENSYNQLNMTPNALLMKVLIQAQVKSGDTLDGLIAIPRIHFKQELMTNINKDILTCVSVDENQTMDLIKRTPDRLVELSHNAIIRVLPASYHLNNTRIDLGKVWAHGVQMTALHTQSYAGLLQLNHGRFLDNGGCGYVLKPEMLRSMETWSYVNRLKENNVVTRLDIEIISAIKLPKPDLSDKGEVIDPYVRVEVHGLPCDRAMQETSVVDDNGFNPVWYEKMAFELVAPELALVAFVVMDKDYGTPDDFVGYHMTPLASMQQGYRHAPVYDRNGAVIEGCFIFVKVSIKSNQTKTIFDKNLKQRARSMSKAQ